MKFVNLASRGGERDGSPIDDIKTSQVTISYIVIVKSITFDIIGLYQTALYDGGKL